MTGLRTFLRGGLAAATLAVCASFATPSAGAASPYLEVVPPDEAMRSPAYRYANMSNEEAFAELDRRRILYTREPTTVGVRAPIRLTGRLHGVHVHSSLPPEQRPDTPFEVLDARLALSIDDFCAILARHEVVELVHYTMYRPNVPAAGWSPAQLAKAAPDDPKEGARKVPSRSAKKRADAGESGRPKGLGKGDKSGKTSPVGRSRAGRKELDDEGESLAPKGLEEADHLGEVDAYGKAAPAKGTSPTPRAAGAPKAPSGGRIASTGRRTPNTLRRPPSRDDGEQLHSHRKPAPPGTRHPAGLAIDFGAVRKRDGSWLSVASHFRGRIGDRTCGAGAPVPDSVEARELRSIVCEARETGVFTYALTPNFDADHADHVHFEIKPGVTWFLFH